MKIYDLSPEISEEMVVYKNRREKSPKIIATRILKEGANESKLDIYVHTGSHVDAPFHVLQNGKTIEKIDLGKFMGKAVVLDFTKIKNSITKNHLKNKIHENQRFSGHRKSKGFSIEIQKNEIVLLKTRNKAEREFNPNFTFLEKSGAEFLALKKIKAVGIDNLGIERSQPNHETHKILLGRNIPIFEGLDLSKVKEGRYYFHGLPLRIRKGDASPVRAILIEQ